MSDLDLTPEQWRMCRRAGASFSNDTEGEQAPEHGEQLAFETLGPAPGELFVNVHTNRIGCVLRSATRRKSWVSIRHDGRVTEVPFAWIGEHWKPCRPDGTLR